MKNEIWKMINGKSFSLPVPITRHFFLEAMKGVEPLSSGLQDRCSVIQLSYIAIRNWWTGRESNPHKKFAGLLCSRLHHQPKKLGGCGWIRTTNLALMRRLLFPFELHSQELFRVSSSSFKFDSRNLRLETCNLKLMIGSPRRS